MAWGTRQQRLKDLLGIESQWVFQVFAQICTFPLSENERQDLIRRYEINFSVTEEFYFPSQTIGPYEFPTGRINEEYGDTTRTELLFTSAPYMGYAGLNAFSHISTDQEVICNIYKAALREQVPDKQFPKMPFEDGGYAGDFMYHVHHYDPALFPRSEMGVLKPFTLVEGHVVRPEVTRITDFSLLRTQMEAQHLDR